MSESKSRGRELLEQAMTTLRTASIDVARERFQAAAHEFEEAGDREGAAEARIEEARALGTSFRASELRAAHGILDDTLPGIEGLGADSLVGRLHHVRGYVHLRGGDFDEAAAALRLAESAFREAGESIGEARVLDTLGVLYERSNDRERAALCLAHSHALKQRAGDTEGVAISLGNLGRLALHSGKAREAEGFFRLDLELARELGDRRGEAVIRTNLSEALAAQGHAVEAGMAAKQSLALSTQLGNDVGEGYARIALAEVALVGKDEYAAREEGRAALAAFERAGMEAGRASARLLLARVEVADGGPSRASAALALAAGAGARRNAHPEVAIEAFLEAHTQLEQLGLGDYARRTLARTHETANTSRQVHLMDRVRSRQTANDVALALRASAIRIRIELGASDFADRVGDAQFEVEGFLGAGTFATVFRVRDLATDKVYAWKQMQGGRERANILSERMRREFRVLDRVDPSPHLVRVHAFGHRDGAPGLLLDLIQAPGRHASLDEAMTDAGRMPKHAFLRTAADVADGLAVLHACDVVHRDVKPGNVLFGKGGRAVVTDCGLAFDAHDDAYVPTSSFAGSLAYAAPELVAPGAWSAPTPAADCYALGVMLYRGLTGRWPIPLTGDMATILRSKYQNDPDVSRLPAAPEGLQDLIGSLCAREPKSRPTASSAASQLRAMLSVDA